MTFTASLEKGQPAPPRPLRPSPGAFVRESPEPPARFLERARSGDRIGGVFRGGFEPMRQRQRELM
jgi:hypothetical protein